jgi:ABC-2 type transport system permease protein
MSIERAGAIVLRQLYLFRGSPARILPLFGWVAIDVVLWGFITRYLNSFTSSGSSGGYNFVPALLGAVLLWDFHTRVMQGVTTAFFEDVWSRNFLNIFATPLLISEYIAGLVLSSIWTSVIGLAVMLVLATGVFGLSFLGYGLLLIPFLLVLFLCGIALGVFASATVLRMGPAAEWLIWPIPAMLSPFAGVFYPLSTLPRWMQWIGRAMPPSYVFEGMRAIIAGHSVAAFDLLMATGLAALYLALSCWVFSRVYQHVVRTGLIARYSAETLN